VADTHKRRFPKAKFESVSVSVSDTISIAPKGLPKWFAKSCLACSDQASSFPSLARSPVNHLVASTMSHGINKVTAERNQRALVELAQKPGNGERHRRHL
jgi:hypothetical protein